MANANYQVVNGVKTLNMHGKNYVEVAERVNQVHEAKAEFDIVKSEPMQVADRWLWVSVITINGHQYMGNVEIKMNAAKNTPDGTNPFECAETSAIGRALGFAGFGSVESIASKDEIERGKPFNGGAQEEKKPAQEATPAARPAQAAPKPQASESKPAEKTAPIPQASKEQWEQIHALSEQVGQPIPAVALNVHQANNVIARLQKQIAENKDAEQADPNRLQAEEKVQKRCRELFGDVKGPATYNRLRAHVAEKFELGDVPAGCMTDEAIGEMWNQIRKLEKKQALAKAS